ncbi:MAG: hypothetical protein C0404_06985 [Verrucomicrobia bacterium]|nr:hypothetical protein [Verrucomicrobiota bacterium]
MNIGNAFNRKSSPCRSFVPNVAALLLSLLMAVVVSGCVEVYELVEMNRDGSGVLTERVRILPRTIRMMSGRKARTGESDEQYKLLTEQASEKRTKALGGVTVKSRKQNTLPDGSLEVETVFDFKDINKVNLWIAPTFASTDKNSKGHLRLSYAQVVWSEWNKKNLRMDRMNIESARPPSQQKFSSPSVLQDYRRVTPIFQDMLSDFKFEIQVKAPKDLEAYEDLGMVQNMPFEGTTVTVYRAYGENVVMNPELIRGLLMGEVGGRTDAYGGDWRGIEQGLPNTVSPYGRPYEGMGVRFLKTIVDATAAPPEARKEEKK